MTKKKVNDTQSDIRTLQREIGILAADAAATKALAARLQARLAAAEQDIAGVRAENASLSAKVRLLATPPAPQRFAVVRRLLGGRR